ncbi:hypothetical protein CAEBREN_29657 [Caenorhabditis brenneri]|uniref:DUF1907 domain-containing protein n=1 Tax=Caenorhabditis brenneri TaxID=135651 RepID=G0NTX6_CAEBE|nr:hypothetical protein CAEBREN_29657 [Caenorhabditis brenneri]
MPDCSENLSAVIENYVPSLNELKEVFKSALTSNFETVEVDIVDCPDLSKSPFNQTSSGFGCNLRIAEVGGPGNLYPGFHIDHQFDISTIGKVCEHPEASVFGPGAGPWPVVGQNCEMVADVNLKTGKVGTRIAECDVKTKDLRSKSIDVQNSYISKYQPGKERKTLQTVLEKDYRNTSERSEVVSLAGQFIIHTGQAKLHVMPHFPGCPFKNNEEVDKWLNYFIMNAPLVCTTVMHSYDPGHNLRLEHTHCYSDHGDAGHYHYDVTPETVSYEGWFAPASKIYRIDEVANR